MKNEISSSTVIEKFLDAHTDGAKKKDERGYLSIHLVAHKNGKAAKPAHIL